MEEGANEKQRRERRRPVPCRLVSGVRRHVGEELDEVVDVPELAQPFRQQVFEVDRSVGVGGGGGGSLEPGRLLQRKAGGWRGIFYFILNLVQRIFSLLVGTLSHSVFRAGRGCRGEGVRGCERATAAAA